MKFGEYIRARRKSLHMRQTDLQGFSQAYISDIEQGNNNPTNRETIEKLARTLQLSPGRVDWLQAYALFDKDPEEYFGRQPARNGLAVNDAGNHYAAHSTPELCVGAQPADALRILGEPSKEVRFGAGMWWFYSELGMRVVFKNDRVETLETI